MAAITPTLAVSLDISAGKYKQKIFTATPGSASDTVALSTYFDTIKAVHAQIIAGMDAALTFVQPTFSGTTVTLVTKGEGGLAATNWDSASIAIEVTGSDEGV